MAGRDDEARAEIRAFVRAHHPDLGGDPEFFAAGLAELRARHEHRGDDRYGDDRYDAPIVVVRRPRRLRRLADRLRRRRHPRVR